MKLLSVFDSYTDIYLIHTTQVVFPCDGWTHALNFLLFWDGPWCCAAGCTYSIYYHNVPKTKYIHQEKKWQIYTTGFPGWAYKRAISILAIFVKLLDFFFPLFKVSLLHRTGLPWILKRMCGLFFVYTYHTSSNFTINYKWQFR